MEIVGVPTLPIVTFDFTGLSRKNNVFMSVAFYAGMGYKSLLGCRCDPGGREPLDHRYYESEGRRRKDDDVDQRRRGRRLDGEEGPAHRYGPAGAQHHLDRRESRKIRQVTL